MTEEQIREMVETLAQRGRALGNYRGWELIVCDPSRSYEDGEFSFDADKVFNGNAVRIEGHRPNAPAAFGAAIAMIDKLETALQGDA